MFKQIDPGGGKTRKKQKTKEKTNLSILSTLLPISSQSI
jgi:hypothetical protein